MNRGYGKGYGWPNRQGRDKSHRLGIEPDQPYATCRIYAYNRPPPLAEQQRIVAEVERRLSVVDEIESAIEINLKRAATLRQSILKRAFEGKLLPQDPHDEPASVLLERIRAERASNQEEVQKKKTPRKGKPKPAEL